MIGRHPERWWHDLEGRELSRAVLDAMRAADRATTARQAAILDGYALYGAEWPSGPAAAFRPRLSANVLASAADTLVAEVTQTEIDPVAITTGGDWEEQSRARGLTAFAVTRLDHAGANDLLRSAALDTVVAGLGCVRAIEQDGASWAERIHPLSIVIDDRQCVDVPPRTLYLRRAMPRSWLVELYAAEADRIEAAPPPSASYWYAPESRVDVVEFVEAWHLPHALGADDGRHVLAVEGCEPLLNEGYERPRFPLAFVRATSPTRGFWGESLLQRAAPAQVELNKLLARRQDSMHLHSVLRVFVQSGSLVKSHFQNNVGDVVEYSGAPPIFATPPAMAPDVDAQIMRLWSWGFELMGVSQLQSSAIKPAGLESKPALRAYHEYATRRHVNFERSIAQAKCVLAEDICEIERAIAERKGRGHRVYYRDGHQSHAARWSEIDIDRDRLHIEIAPVNALSRDPAGRLDDLRALVADGVIDAQQFLELADVADFAGIRDQAVASTELLRQRIDRMLSDGQYWMPPPTIDFARALQLGLQRLLRADLDGAPEERLDMLRRWLLDVRALRDRAAIGAAPQAAPGMPAPEAPGAMAMPGGMPPPPTLPLQ